MAKVQAVVDGYPGLHRDLLTYLRERIKEVLTGASATIVVRLFGPELDVLQRKAAEVGTAMAGVDGAVDLKVQALSSCRRSRCAFDRDRAQQVGPDAGDGARHRRRRMLRGARSARSTTRQKIFDVVVWGDAGGAQRRLRAAAPADRAAGRRLHAARRRSPTCAIVPTPNEIKREGASRRIDVTCNVRGRDLGRVARDIEAALAGVPFDAGYHPEFLGEYAARAESQRRLLGARRWSRCWASCWCCTPTSARCGWWRWSR